MQAARQAWLIGLCEFHRSRALQETADRCATHLTVWWPYGLAFEFSATMVTHVASSTNFTEDRSRRPLEHHAKLLVTTIAAVTSKLSVIYEYIQRQ